MGCNKCGSKLRTCGCSSVPYYQQADVCVEDHTQKVYQPEFNFSVCPTSSWNIPICGQTAVLQVPGLAGATVGSFLWHPQFGFYEINSIDTVNGTIGITNNCTEGNASAGAQVPACTCFIITAPPADLSQLVGVCVAIDFTAPELDIPLDIILTSTSGVTSGDTIEIGTGFYFVSAVKPDNVITIINKGQGIIPGTPVIALNGSGDYQYCLSVISVNPCDRTHIKEGIILTCDGDGSTTPLKTLNQRWVATAINFADDVAAFRPLGSVECTTLTADLTLLAAVANYANVAVADSSVFVVNDVLEIEGGVGFRFLVTAIPDATHIDVTVSPVPAANVIFPADSVICVGSCCETLQREIDDLEDEIACLVQGTRLSIPPALYAQGIVMVPIPPGVGAGSTFEVTVDSNVIEYTAPTDCPGSTYSVRAELQVTGLVDMDPIALSGEPAILSSEIQLDWDNNPGVGGRFNWTDYGNDGLDIGGVYPASTLNAMWATLQVPINTYPITYNGAYVIADTIVASGGTITLRLNYKAIQGDNVPPPDVRNVGIYIIGNLIINKII